MRQRYTELSPDTPADEQQSPHVTCDNSIREITASEFVEEVINGGKVVVVFYSTECAACEALEPKYETCARLFGNDISFTKISRQGNRELALQLGVSTTPTVLFFDNGTIVGQKLRGAITRADLIANINTMFDPARLGQIMARVKKTRSDFEVVILGSNPAGLAAAIYLGQARILTIVVDISTPGEQEPASRAWFSYPGFTELITGQALSVQMEEQARKSGVVFKSAVEVTSLDMKEKILEIDGVETIHYSSLVVATGTSPRSLGVPGEKDFVGRGISYGVGCDAKSLQDKKIIVICEDNSALEELEYISRFASRITLAYPLDKLNCDSEMQERLIRNTKISVLFDSVPRVFAKNGDTMIATIQNTKTMETEAIPADEVLVCAGTEPNVGLFGKAFDRDQRGYIVVNDDKQTSIPGVYAVGDVTSKKCRLSTTAVADGTIAAISISAMHG